jgi:hypothetical protein
MYSIVYIPTGVTLVEVGDSPLASEDFYSLQDCRKFLRNFLEYDGFQRRLQGEHLANTRKWLIRNNRFTYAQYMILFNSLQIKTPFNPSPDSLMREEFTIIKTSRNARTWKIEPMLQRLAEV